MVSFLSGNKRQEHVGVDVGHDLRSASTVGVVGEIPRTEQPFFLTGHRDEKHRPPQRVPASLSMAATSSMAATPEALSIAPL